MAKLIIFRGKSATGKTFLSSKVSENLNIFVVRKDNIFDPISVSISDNSLNNKICYDIMVSLVQENLDSNIDIILDVSLANTDYYKLFLSKINYSSHTLISFLCGCSDESIWISRWKERLKNPLPNRLFKSIDEMVTHYKNMNIELLDDENYIESCNDIEKNIELAISIISQR